MRSGGGPDSEGGWTKMFGNQFASQTGWLYPLGAIALICGIAWRRGRSRTDTLRAGYVLWGTWFAVFFLVFSAGSVGGHSYYMGVIGAPLAALAGAGIVDLWRGFRAGGRRTWPLPVAIGTTVAWAAALAWRFPKFLPWLAPVAIVVGVVALALLGASRLGRFSGRRFALAGVLAGIVAMLVAPGAWAASVLSTKYGNSMMGTVGPANSGFFGGGGGGGNRQAMEAEIEQYLAANGGQLGNGAQFGFGGGQGGARQGGGPGGPGGFGDSNGKLTTAQQLLLDYAKAHQGNAKYVFATTNWNTASPYILATGAAVMPMGGFTGAVPSPSLDGFKQLIAKGELRLVLMDNGGRGMFGGGDGKNAASDITSWVRSNCTQVPPADLGSNPAGQLYDCATKS